LVKILKLAILLILLTACLASPRAYAFTYTLDDGTGEGAVVLPPMGIDYIWANQFTVVPGAERITGIWVAFGPLSLSGPSMDGAPVTVSIWSDPNGDGSPTGDAVLLRSAVGTIANYGTDTFNFYPIPDTVVSGSFFVAATVYLSPSQPVFNLPFRYDNNTQPSPSRSFLTIGGDLSDVPAWQQRPFVFMIRAEGSPATPTPEQEIDDILDFFDNSVSEGTLTGVGLTPKVAKGRLGALRNMLEQIEYFIDNGLVSEACQQLRDAYLKTDNQPRPPDFVSGDGASELASMMQDLMANLGCQ
jgi:hypothetical protein